MNEVVWCVLMLIIAGLVLVRWSLDFAKSVAARAPKKAETSSTARTEPPKSHDISAERYRQAAEKLEEEAVAAELRGAPITADHFRVQAKVLRERADQKENTDE